MKNANKSDLQRIEKIGSKSVNAVVKKLEVYTHNELKLTRATENLLNKEFNVLKKRFFATLLMSGKLVKKNTRTNKKRIAFFNKQVENYKKQVLQVFPEAAKAWVLGGLVFRNQFAGIKYLAGLSNEEGAVIDVLNSASSIALGAENPWLLKMDRIEDHLGLKDNMCNAYHPGLRQGFALKELAKLHPYRKSEDLMVHAESSGTIVDSIAIESCVAFAEKKIKNKKHLRILAVDGTWAGGYGSAREGTGFGIDSVQVSRAGKTVWVDRVLPAPIEKNRSEFLKIVSQKMKEGNSAGLYIEPDILGDLGLLKTDPFIIREVLTLLKKHQLPIILDCVQQLGRTGSYWGEYVDHYFKDYPLTVLTTSKSSANGQPFGYVIMHKSIAQSAQPLTQITTNQMNGPLLRALVVSKMLMNEEMQSWFKIKGKHIEEIASGYGFAVDDQGIMGKYLNRGVYMGSNENVKLAQIALLLEDGILVGALPNALRYQPMLLELTETNKLIAHTIFRRVREILKGNISKEVKMVFKNLQGINSGLARKNT